MSSISIGPVLIGLIVICLLVGLIFYLYATNHHQEKQTIEGYTEVYVDNKTQLPCMISFSEDSKEVLPNQRTKIPLVLHDVITSSSTQSDGTILRHHIKVSKSDIKTIYLTHSGFRTCNSNTCPTVELVNNAQFPVLFIEKDPRGQRRWATAVVKPLGREDQIYVGPNTRWEVALPQNSEIVLASAITGRNPKRLIFDGRQLKSEQK